MERFYSLILFFFTILISFSFSQEEYNKKYYWDVNYQLIFPDGNQTRPRIAFAIDDGTGYKSPGPALNLVVNIYFK